MDNAITSFQADYETRSLIAKLAPLLGGGFFSPLARPTAAVYVDCADRLVEAAAHHGQMSQMRNRVFQPEVRQLGGSSRSDG